MTAKEDSSNLGYQVRELDTHVLGALGTHAKMASMEDAFVECTPRNSRNRNAGSPRSSYCLLGNVRQNRPGRMGDAGCAARHYEFAAVPTWH